jgi:hypothetical protein
MSVPEQQQYYLIPVLKRPAPLSFVIAPADEGQPSIMAGCGHPVWRLEHVTLDGKKVRESTPNFSQRLASLPAWLRQFFAPKQCGMCRFKTQFDASIQCAYCDELIVIGDPVTTYFPVVGEEGFPEGFLDRATHTRYGFVGCLNMDCCPTGGFFAGHWTGETIQSPFAAGVAAAQAMVSGDMIVSDMGTLRP